MAKSPSQVAEKWQRNLSSAQESIRAGVNAVDESPTTKAANRAEAMVSGVQRAVADGKWQRGLQRVTLQDWKQAMLEKGVPRIASGAASALPKVQDFMSEFLPFVEQGVQRINQSNPRGDLEQNIARATALMRHNSSFRRRS